MMTDALQTEDGKKAIRQMFADPEFKELLILEQPEVKKSIEDTLLSKKGEDFWKKTFEDPKFTETIAKSMKEQQQDIMKQLMDDASFQKEMEEFFGQPDMQKQMETVMQSANMKKHLEKVVEETINSPLMQTKWQELILKAGEILKGEKKGVEVGRRWRNQRKAKVEEANSLLHFFSYYLFVFCNNIFCNIHVNFSNWMIFRINRWCKIFFIPIRLTKWNLP